jgi:hypothetical protein
MDSIKYLLANSDVKKLKGNYNVGLTDQPTSTAIFYMTSGQIEIKDYGLKGDFPLQKLYEIIYKLDINFR